ncbi:MAG: hypothetical protein Q9159_004823 [Coniocarpon cinnabarinum]
MPSKRAANSPSASSNKRQRVSNGVEQPRVNRAFGQTGAFPGLDDDDVSEAGSVGGEGLPDDPIQYLKRVRAQANRIPPLLTTLKPSNVDSGVIYGDDAIVAAPSIGPARPPTVHKSTGRPGTRLGQEDGANDARDEVDLLSDSATYTIPAQEAHHENLLRRYHRTQALLNNPPSASPFQNRHVPDWVPLLRTKDPTAKILSSLSQRDAFVGLNTILRFIKWRDLTSAEVGARLQTWTWGLLCRLDSREMDYEEVGRVREVGKRARTLLKRAPTFPGTAQNDKRATEAKQSEDDGGSDAGKAAGDFAFLKNMPSEWKAPRQFWDWFQTLTTARRSTASLACAIRDTVDELTDGADIDVTVQILKWASLSDELRSLCYSLEDEGTLADLSAVDREKFAEVVRTAVVMELEKAEKAGEKGKARQDGTGGNGEVDEDDENELEGEEGEVNDEENTVGRKDEDQRRVTSAYACIDMILTIVGEVFGQRDLLEEPGGRDICWHPMTSAP